MYNEELLLTETSVLTPSDFVHRMVKIFSKQLHIVQQALKRKLLDSRVLDDGDIFTSYIEEGKTEKYYFLKDYNKLTQFLKNKKFSRKEIEECIKIFINSKFGIHIIVAPTQFFDFLYERMEAEEDITPYFVSIISLISPIKVSLDKMSSEIAPNAYLSLVFQEPLRTKLLVVELKKLLESKNIDSIDKIFATELDKHIKKIKITLKLLNTPEILQSLFFDWQQYSQLIQSLDEAFEIFNEIINNPNYKELLKNKTETINEIQELESDFLAMNLENILKIAQEDIAKIIDIKNIIINEKLIKLQNSAIELLEEVEKAINTHSVSFEDSKGEKFEILKQKIVIYNAFAKENNFKILPLIKSKKELRKEIHKIKRLLECEKKKKNYFLLIQFLLKQQVKNEVLEKRGKNGKYRILDAVAFEELSEIIKDLISKYLEEKDVKKEKEEEIVETKEEEEETSKTANIKILITTIVREGIKGENIEEIKQNSSTILSQLNSSLKKHEKDFKIAKNRILNVAILKNLEDRRGKRYSDEENLLIAQNRVWEIEDQKRRELYLSSQITELPESEKFPNGREHVNCPCIVREKMKDENTIELKLLIKGNTIGASEEDISITIEIKKPETAISIIALIRDREIDKLKEHNCSVHIEPKSAEKQFYRHFSQELIQESVQEL
ncbi:MAG: hypothetical protein PHY80_00350 [Rickettsiales bacterium]|nr:hypothetical protein [Rickettsiales bacterium]